MITAIDTNILLDVLLPNERFVEHSLLAIEEASARGSLVICDPVYAELCCQFRSQEACDRFLGENRIVVERLSREAMWAASLSWRRYRQEGGTRDRVLPDFLIGAHAHLQASCLLSRDRGVYGKYFRSLMVIDPSSRA